MDDYKVDATNFNALKIESLEIVVLLLCATYYYNLLTIRVLK